MELNSTKKKKSNVQKKRETLLRAIYPAPVLLFELTHSGLSALRVTSTAPLILFESKQFPDISSLRRRVGFREIERNHPKVWDPDSVGKVCCGLSVRRKVAGDLSEVSPLSVAFVFVANVPGIAFEEVQRRTNKVWEASHSSWDEVLGKFGGTQDIMVWAMSGFWTPAG